MILTFLFTVLGLFLTGIVNILPTSTGLPSGVQDAVSYVVGQISGWTFIFPLSTVFTILGYTLLVETVLWTFHGSVWAYNKLRGI